MSRVGKKPIQIPEHTTVTFQNGILTVKGKKGTLTKAIHPAVDVNISSTSVQLVNKGNDHKSKAIHGLMRSLVSNMVKGVSVGFERILEINGIGYRAELSGKNIILNIGFSHPVQFEIPEGISASVEKNTIIKLSGIDKELLGHTAAFLRRLKPPEPYKGKGIKYSEERIQRKAGKTGTK